MKAFLVILSFCLLVTVLAGPTPAKLIPAKAAGTADQAGWFDAQMVDSLQNVAKSEEEVMVGLELVSTMSEESSEGSESESESDEASLLEYRPRHHRRTHPLAYHGRASYVTDVHPFGPRRYHPGYEAGFSTDYRYKNAVPLPPTRPFLPPPPYTPPVAAGGAAAAGPPA